MQPLSSTGTHPSSRYSDQDRRAAMAYFIVHGNMAIVSKMTNIPEPTLCGWKKTEWWLNTIEAIRIEKQDEVEAGYSNIIELAIAKIKKSLIDGDEVITAKGERLLKRVTVRDAATTCGIIQDKLRILQNLPTTISSRVDNTKLLKLQQQFEDMASKEPKVIDGTVVSES